MSGRFERVAPTRRRVHGKDLATATCLTPGGIGRTWQVDLNFISRTLETSSGSPPSGLDRRFEPNWRGRTLIANTWHATRNSSPQTSAASCREFNVERTGRRLNFFAAAFRD